jgi:tight adherence protein C
MPYVPILLLLGILVVAAVAFRAYDMRSRVRERFAIDDEPGEADRPQSDELLDVSPLRGWLIRAGYRRSDAVAWFLIAQGVVLLAATGMTVAYYLSPLPAAMHAGLEILPGGFGDILLPVVEVSPWIIFVLLISLPVLQVRRERRQRVERIEQDLPVALELMATLSESGLGFDTTIERLFQTRLGDRPLIDEFRRFQADLLAGRRRVTALRRMAQRIQISSMTIFVSALVQAEQIGMGLSGVLRNQAEDLRGKRREQASAFAASLPVKLMFPLITCFLPGIFVWTLGPVFIQFFQLADSLLQQRGGGSF